MGISFLSQAKHVDVFKKESAILNVVFFIRFSIIKFLDGVSGFYTNLLHQDERNNLQLSKGRPSIHLMSLTPERAASNA